MKYVEHCVVKQEDKNDMSLFMLYDLLRQPESEDSKTSMIQLDAYTGKLLQFSSSLIHHLIHIITAYNSSFTTQQYANVWLALQLLMVAKADGNFLAKGAEQKTKSKQKAQPKQILYECIEPTIITLITTLSNTDSSTSSCYSTLKKQVHYLDSTSNLTPTHTDQLLALWQSYELLCVNTHTHQCRERLKQVMKHHAAHPVVVSVALKVVQTQIAITER